MTRRQRIALVLGGIGLFVVIGVAPLIHKDGSVELLVHPMQTDVAPGSLDLVDVGNGNSVTLPVISFKGFENDVYYHLVNQDRQYYMDFSGCGNTFNANHPVVTKYIIESLEYWVTECHVDGFRFDLASTLARGLHEVDRLGAFFENCEDAVND